MSGTRVEIRNIAFSGGGWRTTYGRGVIDELQKQGIFKNTVVKASFCSGSAATAMYLIGGYTSDEAKQFFHDNVFKGNYNSYLYFIPEHIDPDKSPYYAVKKRDGFLKRIGKKLANAGIFAKLVVKNIVDACRSRGIYHPDGLEESLWVKLKNSPRLPNDLKKRDLTFREYHRYTPEFRLKYPELPCIDPYFSVAVEKGKEYELIFYSYETTPDFPILKAGCAAMSLPGVVRRMRDYPNLIDGGVIDISARTAFDVDNEINMQTFAVYFADSADNIKRWRDPSMDPQPTNTSISEKIIIKMVGIGKYLREQYKWHHIKGNIERTLYIDSSDLPTLSPAGITPSKIEEVYRKAEEATRDHLKFRLFGKTCLPALQYNQQQVDEKDKGQDFKSKIA